MTNQDKQNPKKENIISRAYQSLDDSLMYLTNHGVKAWNYTTGKTKADLANKALFLAPIADAAGCLLIPSERTKYLSLGIAVPFQMIYSHYFQKRNMEIEKKEVKALESKCLDIGVEHYKQSEKTWGPAFLLISGTQGWPTSSQQNYNFGLAAGHILRGLSCYIMRADYLPPRKNIIVRAMDKLTEQLQALNRVPVPVKIRNY